MFDLDEMKAHWEEYDRKLDHTLRLNREVLRSSTLNRTQSELQKFARGMVIQAAIWFVIVAALGNFLSAHVAEPRIFFCALASAVYCAGMLAACIRMIAAAKQLDYAGPLAAIQTRIEKMRVFRIRATQAGVLAGIILWAPFFVVAVKATLGLDPVSGTWLLANVGLGILFVPIAIRICRAYGSRLSRIPFIQQVVKDVAGTHLTAAQASLAKLTEFEKEHS
jgi:hypothetical protein